MLSTILGFLSGPFTKLGEIYIQGRNDQALKQIEREVQRDFLHKSLQEALLEDDGKRADMIDNLIRADRGDWRTAWIRPVTAAMALVFWFALTLSQIQWGGPGVLPIIWTVPPGQLGNLFLAFPLGVLGTFFIARPFEKFWIGSR